jgi:hypothetical protein
MPPLHSLHLRCQPLCLCYQASHHLPRLLVALPLLCQLAAVSIRLAGCHHLLLLLLPQRVLQALQQQRDAGFW